MYAKKLNKVIDVNEQTKDFYINQGYDIYEGTELIERGKGTTVSADEFDKLVKENEKLKAEIEKIKAKKTKEADK